MKHYQVREFQPEDMSAVLFAHESSPSQKQEIAYIIDRGRKQIPQNSTLRLVVGKPAIAFLEVIDRSTTCHNPRCIPGVCDVMLFVARDYQNCGIGSSLYDRMLSFAKERHAHTIRYIFYNYDVSVASPSFLSKRGFTFETMRHVILLNLATYDPEYSFSISRFLRENNSAIFHYEDTPENRVRLYNLLHALDNISDQLSFERWSALEMDTVDWEEEVLMLAASDDGPWIGMGNAILHNAEKGVASIPFSGVLPPYRRQGIATALNAKTLEILKQRRIQNVFAFTRVENMPILAVSNNLGFSRDAVQHVYSKNIADES